MYVLKWSEPYYFCSQNGFGWLWKVKEEAKEAAAEKEESDLGVVRIRRIKGSWRWTSSFNRKTNKSVGQETDLCVCVCVKCSVKIPFLLEFLLINAILIGQEVGVGWKEGREERMQQSEKTRSWPEIELRKTSSQERTLDSLVGILGKNLTNNNITDTHAACVVHGKIVFV